jgi:hypothetical protein
VCEANILEIPLIKIFVLYGGTLLHMHVYKKAPYNYVDLPKIVQETEFYTVSFKTHSSAKYSSSLYISLSKNDSYSV